MALFRGTEPSVRPRRTLSGRPVSVQEEIGQHARRARLMSEAVRRLERHPLGSPSARGVALGDGHGMEDLVRHIAPLFKQEISLARWVAIRGALLFLDIICPSDQERQQLMPVMGLAAVNDPQPGAPTVVVMRQASPITSEVGRNVMGLFSAITLRWEHYAEISQMTVQEVNVDPQLVKVGPAMALDFIAWTAIAMLRTGARPELIRDLPEPGLLERPGWYADPLFAKCERYGDGDDWVDLVRVKNGRTWNESSLPLH